MASKHEGVGAIFWVTAALFALLVLIGIFYWMLAKKLPTPHSPERPSSAIWSHPIPPGVGALQA